MTEIIYEVVRYAEEYKELTIIVAVLCGAYLIGKYN
jgi:hypothetical protein